MSLDSLCSLGLGPQAVLAARMGFAALLLSHAEPKLAHRGRLANGTRRGEKRRVKRKKKKKAKALMNVCVFETGS